VDAWTDAWMDGLMGVKAVLRISYSNTKCWQQQHGKLRK
jgi:hypothetical protein